MANQAHGAFKECQCAVIQFLTESVTPTEMYLRMVRVYAEDLVTTTDARVTCTFSCGTHALGGQAICDHLLNLSWARIILQGRASLKETCTPLVHPSL